ncbi:hypothetical protein DXK93_01185 [Achromobacter sp. K91]|nr:hypothetical protein DXK93_01185 [Achromobacter sp. K91]
MNQEYVYEFDLNGYVIIPAAIAWPHLRRLQTYRSDGTAATVGHRAAYARRHAPIGKGWGRYGSC